MNLRRLALVAVLALAVAATGVTAASVSGHPSLRVSLADRTVQAGETTTLALTVVNRAELNESSLTNPDLNARVTTARGVSVALKHGNAPVTVETGSQAFGSIPDGGAVSAPFRVHVAADAAPGTYRLPVTVSYTYAAEIRDDGSVQEWTNTRHASVRVVVKPAARFAVVSTTADVRGGEPGTLAVTLANTGSATARNATVTLASGSPQLGFGDAGAQSAARYVGDWPAGENRTLTYRVTAAPGATGNGTGDVSTGSDSDTANADYAVTAQVAYRDADGQGQTSNELSLGVTPAAAPALDVRNLTSTLRVADRGTLTATVVNTGSTAVRNATVTAATDAPGVRLRTPSRYLGTLDPGASATVAFEADVSPAATAGAYPVAFQTTYDTRDGRERGRTTATSSLSIAPERNPLRLTVRNGTTHPDTDAYHLTVDVTNTGDVPRTNLVLTLAARSPVSTVTPSVYVDRLAPGETKRVTFAVSTDEDAPAGAYPLAVNATSDTPTQDGTHSGPYVLALQVTESPSGVTNYTLLAIAAVVAAVVLAAGWWWLRG